MSAKKAVSVRTRNTQAPPDLEGRVALMLYESLLHVLMEEGVVPKDRVLDAIETVAELMHEESQSDKRSEAARAKAAMRIVQPLLKTFRAKSVH